MSAETPVQSAGNFTRLRLRFRDWRGSRPFWAGVFTLLGGVPIAYFPYATLKLGTMSIAMATTAGAGSLIIGVLLFTLGLTMWFQQATRIFAGVAAIILGLVSLVVSNIGGFIIGFLLSLIGGALAVSWVPVKPKAEGAGGQQAGWGPAGDGVAETAPEGAIGQPGLPNAPYEPADGGAGHGVPAEDANGGHRVG
ncbi:DUF6114 domain-containing protein [Streptomyces yaanensis]|uniref:DUF6114 domain-containing protein n=1 Tax=Streptomyces yaanensis TaxID=1142239 RepID=A0ABV7SEX5_9ACTN|nr:DUF6114 domain-containing protein [Streptomyces sp. CGMCC 4.7035]WNB97856.1 DUF6114 domain-containing protein [Streptomyces sp. CGMCC 4.7035]